MSGCKTSCKPLAKIEYENRYQKNSKPARFGENTRSWFERVRQQVLQLRQSDVRLLLPEERDLSNPLPQLLVWYFSLPCSSSDATWPSPLLPLVC